MENKNEQNLEDEGIKSDKKESKKLKLTIKEIGLERLVIVLLCGIFIIVISNPNLFHSSSSNNNQKSKTNLTKPNNYVKSSSSNSESSTDTYVELYTNQMENKLKTMLKKVNGIGQVEVMITAKSSKELVALQNEPYSQESVNETDGDGGSRISSSINKEDEAVLINEDGNSVPFIVKELEPEIEGVLVIAQGGDNPTIINEIIEAVEVLFDVPTHKIKVMKMN